MLLDHLAQSRDRRSTPDAAIDPDRARQRAVRRAPHGTARTHGDVAVSIREIGTDISAFRDRYRAVAA